MPMTEEQHSHNPDDGERPQKPPGLDEVKLGQRLSDQHDVWRASTSNAQAAVVKCIQAPNPEIHDRIEGSARLLMQRQPEGVVHVLQVEAGGDTVWIVRAFDEGIPLHRVRSLVSPAASQVAAIGIGILEALRSLHGVGMAHGALHEGNVFIGADGSVQLSDPVMSAGDLAKGRREDLAAVEEVLLRLWRPSRRKSAPQLAAILGGQRLRRARSANAAISLLREIYGEETSAGLDTLASRLLMSNGLQAAGDDEVAGGEPTTAMRELDVALAHDRRRRRIRYGLIAASAVVGAMLVAAGTMKLTAHAAHQTSKTASVPRHVVTVRGKLPDPIAQPSLAPTASPANNALPTLAPPAAGFISSASLASSAPCSPGNQCMLTSTINLGPHTDTNITWEVIATNPCTGAQQTISSDSAFASSTYKYVFETQTDTPPAGLVALYVLTTSPARVASAPLLVGPQGCN
jgi:hypothetical protein